MNCSINKKLFGSKELLIINYSLLILLSSCSISKQISKDANKTILSDSAASKGFIGISIYDPATGKYLYNYNATKYFTPASNTKLFSLYAGMKYLGDSLPGLRYLIRDNKMYVLPTGDPSFLNPEFSYQPAIGLLNKNNLPTTFTDANWKDEKYGVGWAWDDYNDDYMVERSSLPIYANLITLSFKNETNQSEGGSFIKPVPSIDLPPNLESTIFSTVGSGWDYFTVKRKINSNDLDVYYSKKRSKFQSQIPLVTDGIHTALNILNAKFPWVVKDGIFYSSDKQNSFNLIRSIPSDSLFRPMMHRSDNFFAEQTLLMASNERLGYMNDKDIIDTLLKSDLKDIPQRPKWVDGSGLSRYNLFTPQSFIYILNKLRNEFGWDRVRNILPTGGQGTLTSYFRKDSGFIYAKTGTLSNNCALSGVLVTNSGKLLIFSILANHYQTGATPIRQASERFLEAIREKY